MKRSKRPVCRFIAEVGRHRWIRYYGVKKLVQEEQIKQFQNDGFLLVENFIPMAIVEKLRSRYEPMFAGDFETKVYPDEWHWRKGISREDVTREIVNSWKCDKTIASVVLSEKVGRYISELMGWEGSRVGQDDIWWKPPGVGEISFHQDDAYFDFLDPERQVGTCWIALDDTSASAGTIEYVKGSHKWPITSSMHKEFFSPSQDYQSAAKHAAKLCNVKDYIVHPVEIAAGGAAFHCGPLWHGSGRNEEKDKMRRSLAIHCIPSNGRFKENKPATYIYGRYKIWDSTELEETFFPITWRKDGYRSPFLKEYLANQPQL